MGHVGRGSRVSRVTWVTGHMVMSHAGHESSESWVTWVVGHVGHESWGSCSTGQTVVWKNVWYGYGYVWVKEAVTCLGRYDLAR